MWLHPVMWPTLNSAPQNGWPYSIRTKVTLVFKFFDPMYNNDQLIIE